jgi:two-component system, sensor histidine kinase PdtaS
MCPVEDATTPDPASDSLEELRLRARQGELIGEFSRMALSGAGSDELLAAAVRIASDGLGAPLAKVLQHVPGEDALLVRAGVGWRPGVVGHARLAADPASPAGYAMKTGAPVISNHLSAEDRFRTPALIAEHGARRAVNVVVRG